MEDTNAFEILRGNHRSQAQEIPRLGKLVRKGGRRQGALSHRLELPQTQGPSLTTILSVGNMGKTCCPLTWLKGHLNTPEWNKSSKSEPRELCWQLQKCHTGLTDVWRRKVISLQGALVLSWWKSVSGVADLKTSFLAQRHMKSCLIHCQRLYLP